MRSMQAHRALDSQVSVATGTVVLVEGISDQRALETLAERRGRNLDAEGVSIVPIGGAQAIGSFLACSARGGRTSGWRACATRPRSATSSAASSGPASAPTSLAPGWNGWGSTCASRTSRTS
jgi:hypothetical protein